MLFTTIVCEDTGEIYNSYRSYMGSKHWQLKKAAYLSSKYYRGCCGKCKKKFKYMNIHHRHYETLGRENLFDLVALCFRCHKEVHCKQLEPKKIKDQALGKRVYSPQRVDAYLDTISNF